MELDNIGLKLERFFLLELSKLTDLDLGQIKFRENMLELVLFELFLKDLKTLLKL